MIQFDERYDFASSLILPFTLGLGSATKPGQQQCSRHLTARPLGGQKVILCSSIMRIHYIDIYSHIPNAPLAFGVQEQSPMTGSYNQQI